MDILLNIITQIGVSLAIVLHLIVSPSIVAPTERVGEVAHEVIPATEEIPVETHKITIPVQIQTQPEIIVVPEAPTEQPIQPVYNVKIEVNQPEPEPVMANPLIAQKEQRLAEIVTELNALQQEKIDLGTGITAAQEASIKERREALLSEQKTLKAELKELR